MLKRLAVPIVILLLLLVACTGTTTSLVAKKSSISLPIGKSVDISDLIQQEGNGKLFYAIENPEVLRLDDSKVTGIAEGNGVIVVEGDGFYLRIGVEVYDNKKVKVLLPDAATEYDGAAHTIEPEGNFPDGTVFSYYCNGASFTGATDAGRYEITVEVTVPEPYHVEYAKQSAVLTIEKKLVDMSKVSFSPMTYTYDGTEKSVTVTGELPECVTVSYKNNVAVDAGVYTAEAVFTVPDENNYYPILSRKTDLTISKKYVNLAEYGFDSLTLTYDGKPHSVLFSGLPAEVSYSYYRMEGETKVPLSDDYSYVDSGEYTVYATLVTSSAYENNHAFVSGEKVLEFDPDGERRQADANAKIYLRKGNFYSDYVWKLTKDGQEVASVPYGEELVIGDDGEYSLRLVGTSHGVNGEFPQGAQVRYGTLPRNVYGNVNSGVYTVKGSFYMPEGSDKNYNKLPDIDFSLTVDRGRIDMSGVTFGWERTEAVFDPDVYYNDFAVSCVDTDRFNSNLTVSYTYKMNGNLIGAIERNAIHSAAEYQLIASFTVVCADKDNYYTPPPMTFTFTVKPVVVEMDVIFSSLTVTYDGTPHELAVEGNLPTGLTMTYTVGETKNLSEVVYTDAGTYYATAVFSYGDERSGSYRRWEKVNYVLKNGGKEITELSAVLTVNKASINKEETDLSVYTQKSIPTYSTDLMIGDIELNGNENGYVRFKTPSEKIKLIGSDVVKRQGISDVVAVYNRDVANYDDYEFHIMIRVAQVEIALENVTVADQFVAYTGQKVAPVTDYDGDALVSATVASDSDLVSVGKHLCTVTLAVKDPHAYYLTGNNVFTDVAVYVYNAAIYRYAPGTCSLVSYLGSDPVLSLPEGTTGIRNGAFVSARSLSELTLPDSLQAVADGGLRGASALTSLSTPIHLNISKIFGEVVPDSFTSVTVRKETIVPTNAFKGLLTIKKIVYLSDVSVVKSYAFDGCAYLEEILFPNVPDYEYGALSGCRSIGSLTVESFPSANYFFDTVSLTDYSLKSVTVLGGTSIADEAFKDLYSLQEVIVPDALLTVGKRAFCNTSATIDLSSTHMTSIGENAFERFSGEVIFPATLQTIEAYAFYHCRSERLLFPKTVVDLGTCAFSGCKATVSFPADSLIEEIGEKAFYEYAGPTFVFPVSVKSMGASAFEKSDLKNVLIGADVVLSTDCFKNCDLLTDASIGCASVPAGAFSGCKKLMNVTFTGTVTIGENAFSGCLISEVTLPATLTELGAGAFSGCPVASVTMQAENAPAIAVGVFPTDRPIAFYVPLLFIAQYTEYVRAIGCDPDDMCVVRGVDY